MAVQANKRKADMNSFFMVFGFCLQNFFHQVIGIDSVPDTDLPGAVAGQLKSRGDFTAGAIEPATAAFGQGFSLTPLKLVQQIGRAHV